MTTSNHKYFKDFFHIFCVLLKNQNSFQHGELYVKKRKQSVKCLLLEGKIIQQKYVLDACLTL